MATQLLANGDCGLGSKGLDAVNLLRGVCQCFLQINTQCFT